MMIHDFREMLAQEIEAAADQGAIANGSSMSRDFGEYRAKAGVVVGLRMAADIAREFLKIDEENEDD